MFLLSSDKFAKCTAVYFVGRESVKKPKRSSSFDSADHNVIMAAGESSQTNCAAFIEEQKQMLHEYNSSKVSLPTTRDVRMSNEERTDSASNMNFNEEHYKNTPPNSDLNNPTPITKQPGLSNVGGRSYCGFVQIEKEDYDKVMQQRKKGWFDTFLGFKNVHSRIFWLGKFGKVLLIWEFLDLSREFGGNLRQSEEKPNRMRRKEKNRYYSVINFDIELCFFVIFIDVICCLSLLSRDVPFNIPSSSWNFCLSN